MDVGMQKVLDLIKDKVLDKHPLVLVEEVEKMIMDQPIIVPTLDDYIKFFNTHTKALKAMDVTRVDQMLTSKPSSIDNLLRTTLGNAVEAAGLEANNVRLIPVSAEIYLEMVPMIRAVLQLSRDPVSQPYLAGAGDSTRELLDEIHATEEDLLEKKRKAKLDRDVPPLYDSDGNFIEKNLYNRYQHQK